MLIIGVNKSVCQTVDFTYSVNTNQLCSPATIKFTQHSSGNAKGFLWDFGNRTRSNFANPSIVYQNAGTYKVRLIVVYENNTKEISKTIIIKPSTTVSLASDRDLLCTASAIQFTVGSTSPVSNLQWDFGDTTALQNSNTGSITHSYTNFGEFTAKVICTSSNGCKSFASKVIKIIDPVITGSFTRSSGCVPIANSFQSLVTLPASSTVNNYHWDWGDGIVSNSSTANMLHSYNNAGNFSPKLTITTNDGCTKGFTFDSVHYGTAPTNLVARPLRTILCGSESAGFIAKADQADHYDWDFGTGSIISTTDTLIQHKFSTLGTKIVSVTPRFNNCSGTTQTMQVEVIGVIANFSYQNSCNNKRTFQLNNSSSGHGLNFLWEFGDQSSNSVQRNILHSYPISGSFNTVLIANDPVSGCADTSRARIEVRNPNLTNPHNSICVKTSTQFRVTNSYNNNTCIFLWHIMGTQIDPSHDSIISISANVLGNYSNEVIIKNGASYCPDTLQLNHRIIVKGPHINFTADSSFCLSKALSITNLSNPYIATDTIRKYYWNFGDTTLNIESLTSPVYKYKTPGNYQVRLIGVDIYGCRDSLVKEINVRPMPFLWIIPKQNAFCLGGNASMIAYTSDSLLWNNTITSPGFCITCDTNTISPIHTTQYYATSTNSFNCKATDSAFVKIYEPFTAASITNDTSICEHISMELKVSPTDKQIIWTPTLGLNNSNNYNPTLTTSQSGLFMAKLTDSAGCFSSSTSINIRVNSNPTVELGNNKLLPYNSVFTFNPSYSSNVIRYEWSPASTLSCSSCAYPQTTINDLKSFTVKVTSDSGCVSTDNVMLAIECDKAYIMMPGAFTPNNDGLNDVYYPLSNGIKFIKRFAIYNRNSQLLFEQKEFSPNKKSYGWDGKYMNTLQPIGAYVYIIEAVCELGETTVKKGSFMLL